MCLERASSHQKIFTWGCTSILRHELMSQCNWSFRSSTTPANRCWWSTTRTKLTSPDSRRNKNKTGLMHSRLVETMTRAITTTTWKKSLRSCYWMDSLLSNQRWVQWQLSSKSWKIKSVWWCKTIRSSNSCLSKSEKSGCKQRQNEWFWKCSS